MLSSLSFSQGNEQLSLVLDSTKLDTESNTFTYLILNQNDDTLYSYDVRDYSVECNLEYSDIRITSYTFYDLVSGSKWSVINDLSINTYGVTDIYDRNAINDKINYSNLDLSQDSIEVYTGIGQKISTYRVKLNPFAVDMGLQNQKKTKTRCRKR